jgi:hypothetical protein
MISAAVLTNNSCPNSRAFNCPLLAAGDEFASRGLRLRFVFNPAPGRLKVPAAEIIMINSNVFRPFWRERGDMVLDFLARARAAGRRTVWFDTTDSTWCTQFQVLPLVDVLLKSQILADPLGYLTPTRTGRVFTDSFDALYQSGECGYSSPPPDLSHLHKLGVSWNSCFENYTQSRHGLIARIGQRLRPFTANRRGGRLAVPFTQTERPCPVAVSCRIGLGHSRPSIVAHRQAVIAKLTIRGVECGKIPLPAYFRELCAARVGVGPFGAGEITLRDFEIIICGAALLKPDLGHLRTWPDLFRPGETFVAHRWDLSDFDQRLDWLLAHTAESAAIAAAAQDAYQRALSPAGMAEFAERLMGKINGAGDRV